MEKEEAEDKEGGRSESASLSESEGDEGEVIVDDWKPHKSEKHLRKTEKTRKRRVEHSGVKMMRSPPKALNGESDAPLS